MIRFTAGVLVLAAAWCTGLVEAVSESFMPILGTCYSNRTHWCDDNRCNKLPPCWVGLCHQGSQGITVGSPCSAGVDIRYPMEELIRMVHFGHCYPSAKNELTGRQCCGGYPICAHWGENRDKFNLTTFLKIKNDLYQGTFNHFLWLYN